MKVQDTKFLELIYLTSIVERLPLKPYPEEESVKFDLGLVASSKVRDKPVSATPAEFVDASLLKELEAENFFARLDHQDGKTTH